MVMRGRYIHPMGRAAETEEPVRTEISRMLTCIHAANYSTAENSAEEAGYTGTTSGNGRNAVVIRVVEYFTVREPVFLGLFMQEMQKMKVICMIRYEGSGWKIHDTEVFDTEKLADLFRHFRYYNLKVLLEGISGEYLNELFIEARNARPGAIDRPLNDPEENSGPAGPVSDKG